MIGNTSSIATFLAEVKCTGHQAYPRSSGLEIALDISAQRKKRVVSFMRVLI